MEKSKPFQILMSEDEWKLLISKSSAKGYASKGEYIRDLIKNDGSHSFLKDITISLKEIKNLLIGFRIDEKNNKRNSLVNDYVFLQLLGKILIEIMGVFYPENNMDVVEDFIRKIKEKAVEIYK